MGGGHRVTADWVLKAGVKAFGLVWGVGVLGFGVRVEVLGLEVEFSNGSWGLGFRWRFGS